MFLLLGMRPVTAALFLVTFVCGHCGTAAQQRIVREQRKLTLFFVPLLSIGTSWFVQCEHCGASTSLTKDQATHSLAWASSHGLAAV